MKDSPKTKSIQIEGIEFQVLADRREIRRLKNRLQRQIFLEIKSKFEEQSALEVSEEDAVQVCELGYSCQITTSPDDVELWFLEATRGCSWHIIDFGEGHLRLAEAKVQTAAEYYEAESAGYLDFQRPRFAPASHHLFLSIGAVWDWPPEIWYQRLPNELKWLDEDDVEDLLDLYTDIELPNQIAIEVLKLPPISGLQRTKIDCRCNSVLPGIVDYYKNLVANMREHFGSWGVLLTEAALPSPAESVTIEPSVSAPTKGNPATSKPLHRREDLFRGVELEAKPGFPGMPLQALDLTYPDKMKIAQLKLRAKSLKIPSKDFLVRLQMSDLNVWVSDRALQKWVKDGVADGKLDPQNPYSDLKF